ncbi:MAG: DUF4391 domain-containing protein [Erythrobacter sp.]
MTVTPQMIRDVFGLPPSDAPARRIAKDILAEHGAANAQDRKLIDNAIERLDWWATLSPATISVAAYGDEERPVPAIQLLALSTREQPPQRLLSIIHRSIPVPVILLTGLPGAAGTRISLAPLRKAERIGDKMVVERVFVSLDLTEPNDPATAAFLASLDVAGLPRTNLHQLYHAIIERMEAYEVAKLTSGDFRLTDNPLARREALERYYAAEDEWIMARAKAKREKVLSRQVELGAKVRELRQKVDALLAGLGG